MEEKQCEICGKVIEGYNENHVSYLMKQHQLTHENHTRSSLRKEKGRPDLAPSESDTKSLDGASEGASKDKSRIREVE